MNIFNVSRSNRKKATVQGIAILLFFMAQSFSPPETPTPPQSRPNVIVILTDDQGYGDMSVHGNPVLKTPVLDRLYAQSIRLTDYHTAPMCSPTRGQLLTGRDAVDNGCTAVCLGRAMVREDLPTMADIFKASGYRTAHFGKWHMGDSYPYRPQDRGFQTTVHHGAFGIGSIADHYNNTYWAGSFKDEHDSLKKFDKYCSDEWFDLTINYIKASKASADPFFLYLATNCPHSPHLVDDKYSKPYLDKGMTPQVARFFGQIANIDENMDRLLSMLDKTGIGQNTILIYTTDNGTVLGHEVFDAGMRGSKTLPYEGGHRVPFFLRWPNGKLGQPRDIAELTQVQDVLPTLIDLCALKAPANAAFDGKSLKPLLTGKNKKLKDRILVVEYDNPYKPKENKAVLWNTWRLVKDEELYDLQTDPRQQHDIAAQRPDIVRKLQSYYAEWKKDALKGYEQTRYIHVGSPRQNPTTLYSPDWQGSYADTRGDLMAGDRKGSWDIQVETPGLYEITLHRWHPDSGLALTDAVTNPNTQKIVGGVAVAQARIRFGDISQTIKTADGSKEAKFTIELGKGNGKLQTMFLDEQGKELCSAYFTTFRLLNAVSAK